MYKLFITVGAMLIASASYAAEITGNVDVDLSKKANNDIGAKTSIDIDVTQLGLGGVELEFGAEDGAALDLENWNLSTYASGVKIELGDDHNLIPEAAGDTTTLTTTTQKEALKLSLGNASVVAQFDNWENDLSDIDTVQGAYATDIAGINITTSFDYNLDTENTILGSEIDGVQVGELNFGGALTYDVDNEKWAYEGRADAYGFATYLNGDKDDSLQNIGSEYEYKIGSTTFTAGANYDLDNEDLSPTATMSFAF